MVALVYDLIILAILAFFLWRGWHKGLILSLCGLVVVILSLVGANFIADTAAPPVAKALQPKLAQVIEENVSDYLDAHFDPASPNGNSGNMWDGMREMGGIYAWCADSVEDAIDHISRSLDTSEIFAIAANHVATQIAHHILFAVAFVVLFVLLTLLLHALDLVAKLPGLHFCNGLGGGLIGLVKGVLVLFVALCVLRISSSQLFAPEMVEKTHLFKFFAEINPILSFFPPA